MASFAEQIWNTHIVKRIDAQLSALYIDRVVLHERTGGIALKMLSDKGLSVRKPEACIATLDHIINTDLQSAREAHAQYGEQFIHLLRSECLRHGIRLFDLDDPERGISHILAIEQGLARSGRIVICPDSHVSTVGAVGALGLAVGSTECQSVLASQILIRPRPTFLMIQLLGDFDSKTVSSKDLSLALLRYLGPYRAQGCILEFQGAVMASLNLDQRLTLCNLAAESGAESAVISFQVNQFEPEHNDNQLCFSVAHLKPQITWGTHPAQVIAIDETVPVSSEAFSKERWHSALKYMGLQPGACVKGEPIQGAFIGSCGNASFTDILQAAQVLKGKRVAEGVKAICVPASEQIRRRAEQAGLDTIYKAAGFQWHRSGCAMCNSFNTPFKRGDRVMSTSNRNYEGRQGAGVRTHLASPVMVAASAITGQITDPRDFL